MSNVSEWSTTAASNNSAPPDGAPEGMLAGKVNDVMREMMAAMAKVYQDQRGSLASTGSANAYVLTTNNGHAALSDLPIIVFDANFENTGTATLNVDTLGAKTIYKSGGLHPLEAGDIKEGSMVVCVYNPTDDHFEMINNARSPMFPKGHLFGLGMSQDTDADHDILVAVGEATSDDYADGMVLSTAITKQIDSAWAVGDDAGGLDTGSVAADTTYHVFLIKRSDTGVVDVLFSTSATSPTMPSNYDRKRRIGSFLTNSLSNIWDFTQYGDFFYIHDAVDGIADDAKSGTTPVTDTLLTLPQIPTGVIVSPILSCYLDSDGYWTELQLSSAGGPSALLAAGGHVSVYEAQQYGRTTVAAGLIWTNTSGQVYYSMLDSGGWDDIDIYTLGWLDNRGKQN